MIGCRTMLAVAVGVVAAGAAARGLAGEPVPARRDVLVEAESFSDLGGWVVDQQFMDVMGSPYLLAHGLGKPVAPARTEVAFPAPGAYRLWVRTKDWVPSHHPGTFKVIVDGTPVAAVFGNQGQGWLWQDGGTVQVRGGKAVVELADLTGFDGRCDALLFTASTAPAPPNEPGDAMAAWRRKLLGLPDVPPSAGEFDVVVVGGGIGGTAAAVAAARLGCTVALVQDRPVLGGNASSEVRVHTGAQSGPNIVDEINANYNAPAGAEPHPTLRFDQRRHAVVEAEESIRLFLNWRAFRAVTRDKRLTGVDAKHIRTGEERRFVGRVYVDCTGDASVGAWAGASYRVGREARSEFNEPTAPEKADRMTLGTSLMWGTRPTAEETAFPDLPWAREISKDLVASGGDWTWEYGHYLDTIQDAERIRDHLLRAIYGAWSSAKNGPDKAKYAKMELGHVPYVGGKRENRRLLGDYLMTEHDVREAREFPDGVATGSWPIDLHYPKNYDFRTYAEFIKVKPYPIPYRCLYSKDIGNLMMAGRNISVTHVALGSTRLMNTHGQMGVAVGAAAWLCKKYETTPRGVYDRYLQELLAILKGEGDYRGALKPKKPVPGVSVDGPAPPASPATGLKVGRCEAGSMRCTDKGEITDLPPAWRGLPCVTLNRGPFTAPAPGYAFEVDRPVTVYLAVHERGTPSLPEGWQRTDLRVRWKVDTGQAHTDAVYRKDFPAGKVEVPGHAGRDGPNFGLPNLAVIGDKDAVVKPASPPAP